MEQSLITKPPSRHPRLDKAVLGCLQPIAERKVRKLPQLFSSPTSVGSLGSSFLCFHSYRQSENIGEKQKHLHIPLWSLQPIIQSEKNFWKFIFEWMKHAPFPFPFNFYQMHPLSHCLATFSTSERTCRITKTLERTLNFYKEKLVIKFENWKIIKKSPEIYMHLFSSHYIVYLSMLVWNLCLTCFGNFLNVRLCMCQKYSHVLINAFDIGSIFAFNVSKCTKS